MKRFWVVLSFFVILTMLVMLFVFLRKKSTSNTPLTLPTPTNTLHPTFPDTSTLLLEPNYSFGVISTRFPTSLPIYSAQAAPQEKDEITRVASIFEIKSQPTINNAIDGSYYVWPQDPGLIVGPGGQHVDYNSTVPTDTPLTETDSVFTSLGQKLATSVLRWYPMRLTSTLYFSPENNELHFVPRIEARAIQLTYLPTLEGLPLIAGAPRLSETIVRYSATKSLSYYSGYIYPQFTSKGQSTPIISVQDAQKRLLLGEGSILFASSKDDINAHDSKWYRFSTASMDQAYLAYYYDFTRKQLSPVFIFEGTATDQTTGKIVDVVSVVSALP